MMRQYFEDGYKVIVSDAWGDAVMEDLDDIADYEDDCLLDEVDEEEKVAYFYFDYQD